MSRAVAIRRVHAVLAALAVLAFIAAMAVASPPGHAVPLAGEDNELNVTIDMKVTVKSDDTFEASFVITDQTNYSLASSHHQGQLHAELLPRGTEHLLQR